MARFEFVGVSRLPQQTDLIGLHVTQPAFTARWNRDVLPRYGAAVLQPGHADFPNRNPQSAGQMPRQILSRDILLFDPQEEVVSPAGRLVRWNLLDHEIVRLLFDDSPDSGKIVSCTSK